MSELPPPEEIQGVCHCGHEFETHDLGNSLKACTFGKCDCPYYYPEIFWRKAC